MAVTTRPTQTIKLWPLAGLVFLACSAANFVGGFLGLVGAILSAGARGSPNTTLGILVGGAVGLAAGAGWCVLIVRGILRGLRRSRRASPRIVGASVLWAALPATGGTLALAARLMLASDAWGAGTLLTGLGAGAAVGTAYGLAFGLLAWAATALAARKQQAP